MCGKSHMLMPSTWHETLYGTIHNNTLSWHDTLVSHSCTSIMSIPLPPKHLGTLPSPPKHHAYSSSLCSLTHHSLWYCEGLLLSVWFIVCLGTLPSPLKHHASGFQPLLSYASHFVIQWMFASVGVVYCVPCWEADAIYLHECPFLSPHFS